MKGLRLEVLRPASGRDGTDGGLTSRCSMLTLVAVCDGSWVRLLSQERQVDEVTPEAPAVALAVIRIGYHRMPVLRPVAQEEGRHGMPSVWFGFDGGNFATSPASRLWDVLEEVTGRRLYGALPVHDRIAARPPHTARP